MICLLFIDDHTWVPLSCKTTPTNPITYSLHSPKMHDVASNARFSEAPSSFTGKLQGNGHQHNNRHFFQMVYFLSEDPQKDRRTYRKHTDVYLDESTAVPSAVYFPRAIWIIYSFSWASQKWIDTPKYSKNTSLRCTFDFSTLNWSFPCEGAYRFCSSLSVWMAKALYLDDFKCIKIDYCIWLWDKYLNTCCECLCVCVCRLFRRFSAVSGQSKVLLFNCVFINRGISTKRYCKLF